MSKDVKKPKSQAVTIDEKPLQTAMQKTLEFADTANGKILCTIENTLKLIQFHDITCRYNLISKTLEIDIPNFTFSLDNRGPASLTYIESEMKKSGMQTARFENHLGFIGEMNQFNPVLDWITSKSWDGISRIKDLCSTIKARDEDSKNLFIERWLCQAVALAMYPNADAAGILVLQGSQGLGKTWWFRKLVPEHLQLVRTGANVNPNERDSVSQIIRYWIVELGEIGSTFKRSDIDALKAFLTKESDILRRPYGAGDQVYPRRTALAASVNAQTYLHDDTGNRRFWTVACEKVDSYHNINMQQLWAEIYHLLINGRDWRITAEEKKLVDKINEAHQQVDPIEEMIVDKYRWESAVREWKTATRIAEDIGIRNIDVKITRRVGEVIRKLNLGVEKHEKKSGGQRLLLVPDLKF